LIFPVALNPEVEFFLWSPILKPPGTLLATKKNPRAYFDPLHLCTKFHPKKLTLSASNSGVKNPPKVKFGHGWFKSKISVSYDSDCL
jgi:hypothetical protein